jgi:hypothetical protein
MPEDDLFEVIPTRRRLDGLDSGDVADATMDAGVIALNALSKMWREVQGFADLAAFAVLAAEYARMEKHA